MELNSIYIGFTKDGKERCLQKKYKKLDKDMFLNDGKVWQKNNDYPYFFDLENNCIFYNECVDYFTLRSVIPLFGKTGHEFKRKVVKAYQADRDLLIDTKRMFYGNLIEKRSNSSENKVLSENILFARMADPEGRVMSLASSVYYPFSAKSEEGLAVEEVRPIVYSQFEEQMQPKRKLLEMNYKNEL